MAQRPDAHSGHGATDAASADEVSCCAVCMEPADWVAAGQCGHREVCVNCAVRMRFFQDDRRCCICRALCPTVVITKSDDGGQQPDAASAFSKPSGKYFFYHGSMAAYFTDREQYEAARKACSLKPPCPNPAAGVEDDACFEGFGRAEDGVGCWADGLPDVRLFRFL
ncbi:hypothetical protein EJB05_54797, partial [Eragrostis curvula]